MDELPEILTRKSMIDRDGRPIDQLTWGQLKQDIHYSRVGRSRIGHALLKTDWVGYPPDCIFESMLFARRRRDEHAPWKNVILGRYETLTEARIHHVRLTQRLRARGMGVVGLTASRRRLLERGDWAWRRESFLSCMTGRG